MSDLGGKVPATRSMCDVQEKQGSLPDFLIIGTQKGGTTSLYTYLAQHPQIIRAHMREVQYFSIHYQHGPLWYRSNFPTASQMKKGSITGEASPYYLFHPHAPKRIFELLPHAKLIALLRDPVDRAISHYFHEIRLEKEYLPIEIAFSYEEKRIKKELIKLQQNERYYSDNHRHHSYKMRGVYVDQLLEYLKYFSIHQILVLKSEELFSNPQKILKDVSNFLGVDMNFLPNDLTPQNVGIYRTKVPDHLYKELVNYYAPYNERLYQLLGYDLGWKAP